MLLYNYWPWPKYCTVNSFVYLKKNWNFKKSGKILNIHKFGNPQKSLLGAHMYGNLAVINAHHCTQFNHMYPILYFDCDKCVTVQFAILKHVVSNVLKPLYTSRPFILHISYIWPLFINGWLYSITRKFLL